MAGFHVRQTQPSGLSRSSRQRAEEGRACSLGRSLILKTCRHLLESFQQWGACHLPRLPVSWKASLCRQFHSSWEAGTSCPGAFALAVSSAATWNEPGPFPGRGPCSFLRAAVRPHPLSPSPHQCLSELSDAQSSSGVPKAFLGAGARPYHAVRSVRLQGGLSCPGPQS